MDQPFTTANYELSATPDEVCPFSRLELRAMLRAPLRTMDQVLTERRRFARNVAEEHRLPTVMLVLFLTTLVFALPFGAVLGLATCWRVAALWLGGMAICLPSLHVFGKYLGARLSWMQTVCVSLSATAIASLFAFAFAPILGFFRLTMSDAQLVTPHGMAVLLLVLAFSAGVGGLLRLLQGDATLRGLWPFVGRVLGPWLVLYVFITLRLAELLGLV